MLESQAVTLLRLTAQRAPVRGGTIPAREIKIELAGSDITPDALHRLVATIAKLTMVLTAVVPDPHETTRLES